MKTTTSVILLLISILCFASCQKIPKGTLIEVSGQITTENVKGAVPNAWVFIFEYKAGMYGPKPSSIIDSTQTDENGNYSIITEATGNGVEYRVGFRAPENFVSYLNSPKVLNTTTKNVVNFECDKLSILKSHFVVSNNPNPPLFAEVDCGYSLYQYKMNSSSADTIIYMYAFPDRTNIYRFYFYVADSPNVRRSGADTIQLDGFSDTFEHTFQIDASTFK